MRDEEPPGRTLDISLFLVEPKRLPSCTMECRICKATTYGKPVCERHVLTMETAQQIRAELAERREELRRVRKNGVKSVRVKGSRCREILGLLELGPMSKLKLSTETRIPYKLIEHYVRKLMLRGFVRVRPDARGPSRSWIAELVQP